MTVSLFATVPAGWADPILNRAQAEALLEQPHTVLFGIGKEAIQGHILATLQPHAQADIITLYVPPSQRRSGHGKLLVEATLGAAISAKCTGLTLEVAESNTAAIRLYSVCGLQQVAKRPGYYRNPVSNLKEDALVLAVTLA